MSARPPTPHDARPRVALARSAWSSLLVAAPFIGLYPVFVMKVLCFALFACAFNLLLGYTGLLSFGHAAFFGAAAYATGWLVRSAGWPPELGVLAGVVVAALLGLVVGLIAIRRQGIYFAMITLALAQMIYFVCLQAPFTGGEDGLQGVPRGKLFGLLAAGRTTCTMYYVVLAVFVAVFLFILRIVHSPFGQVLKAIRENEPRAISLGYDVDRYKLLAFVLSAALAGLAGSLKTLVLGFATLSDVHWSLSGEVVLMTLLGGMGTFAGPVLGAFTIIGLQNLLADRVGSWVTVIIGVIFVVCVVAFRRGFVGELQAWQLQRKRARTTLLREHGKPSQRGEMSKRMTKGELQESLGALNPVGHVGPGVRRRRGRRGGAGALRDAGFADRGHPRLHRRASSSRDLEEMMRNASGAAGFGYEITLMRRYMTLPSEGAGWLIVYAPDDGAGRAGHRRSPSASRRARAPCTTAGSPTKT